MPTLTRHLLNEDQAGDLRLPVQHLPILLSTLKTAGMIQGKNQTQSTADGEKAGPQHRSETVANEKHPSVMKHPGINTTRVVLGSSDPAKITAAVPTNERAATGTLSRPLGETPPVENKTEDPLTSPHPHHEKRPSLDN